MNPTLTIYHNANCSKSSDALTYLRDEGYEPKVVEYMASPLSESQIKQLVKRLGIAPSSMIRAREFRALGLEPTDNGDKLIKLIAEHPALMERPIVEMGGRAIIARPLDRLYEFLFQAPRNAP